MFKHFRLATSDQIRYNYNSSNISDRFNILQRLLIVYFFADGIYIRSAWQKADRRFVKLRFCRSGPGGSPSKSGPFVRGSRISVTCCTLSGAAVGIALKSVLTARARRHKRSTNTIIMLVLFNIGRAITLASAFLWARHTNLISILAALAVKNVSHFSYSSYTP